MRTRQRLAALIAVTVFALSGCATADSSTPSSSAAPAPGMKVPDGVDLAEWSNVYGSGVMTLTPAFAYPTLDELADASELVVIGRVVAQHPFPDHDMITTLSLIEVDQVLKGSSVENPLKLYTIGTPVYLEQHFDVDGAGDPPLFDRSYVMHLKQIPELTNAEGKLVPVEGIWSTNGLGHYVQNSSGTFDWDGDDAGSEWTPPHSVTLDDIRASL